MGRLLETANGDTSKPGCTVQPPENDPHHPAHNAIATSVVIGTHPTTILVQPFDDTILVTVTQNDRMGTMVSRAHVLKRGLRCENLRLIHRLC